MSPKLAWLIPVAIIGAGLFLAWHFYTVRWSEMTKPDAFMCAFGSPVCSVAVATWALVLVGIFAFTAAMIAAHWARQAYKNETEPRLGQDACTQLQPHRVDQTFFLSEDLVLSPHLPFDPNLKDEDYDHQHHAFTNLGRCALGNVAVLVRFVDELGERSDDLKMALGNLGVSDNHREKHIDLRIPKKFYDTAGRVSVVFVKAYSNGKEIAEFLRVIPEVPASATTPAQMTLDELFKSLEDLTIEAPDEKGTKDKKDE